MFLNQQKQDTKEYYFNLLKAMGSLSKLFSNNAEAPYLYYRSHENIFCKAFKADNLSRSDVAIDATKDQMGIGLKTFIYKSSQFEKVAEFNKLRADYNDLKNKELIKAIAEARNDRLDLVKNTFGVKDNIYHCVARQPNKFYIYETGMQSINTDQIVLTGKNNDQIVNFYSGNVEYKFNRSKSTLFQKFIPNPANAISIDIRLIEDPYQMTLDFFQQYPLEDTHDTTTSCVVLPLYSDNKKQGKHVHPHSGPNQWNAFGRPRHQDEVYIQIPIEIRKRYPSFFPPRNKIFSILLPDRNRLQVKVCQDGGKALMSNPNKALGNWLLRQVLKLQEGELLTYDRLNRLNVDSVSIEKNAQGEYRMDFQRVGAYEEFLMSSEI